MIHVEKVIAHNKLSLKVLENKVGWAKLVVGYSGYVVSYKGEKFLEAAKKMNDVYKDAWNNGFVTSEALDIVEESILKLFPDAKVKVSS